MKIKKIVYAFVGIVLFGMMVHGTLNPMRVSLLYKHLGMLAFYVYTVFVLTEKRHG